MSDTFTVYIEVVDADGEVNVDTIEQEVRSFDGVASADVRLEEHEKSELIEAINQFTVTLTAVGGAVGASALLSDAAQRLIRSTKGIRRAWLETPDGLQEVQIDHDGHSTSGHTPKNENPAQ